MASKKSHGPMGLAHRRRYSFAVSTQGEVEERVMTRWIVLFGLAFAFAVAAPMGFEAEARQQSKRCTATNMDGKRISWACRGKQVCCYQIFINKGTCLAPGEICLF
jgi:hypothetical protein